MQFDEHKVHVDHMDAANLLALIYTFNSIKVI